MTGACLKNIVKRQRAQDRIPARTAAGNGYLGGIHATLPNKVARGVNTVSHISNSPLAIQAFTVGATITAATPVVDVHERKTTAGPKLGLKP